MTRSRISVAPMIDWTDRHCRYFMRLLNPDIKLYTEMIAAAALMHGDVDKLLRFDVGEHPLALQIGGSDPQMMAAAAKLGQAAGYDEININVGCPSDRVQSGSFGACLMSRPDVVSHCVEAIRARVAIPVSIKTRIGIDDQDSYSFLQTFVRETANAGCQAFVIHARKAILHGLSPKQNRTVPPLDYPRVYRLKKDFPSLTIVLNGGVTTVDECRKHLAKVDGVMIGRQAYHQPWFLTELQQAFAGDEGNGSNEQLTNRLEVIERMTPYIERELSTGTELKHITRHLLGLFAGQPGARAWRRYLSEHAHQRGAGIEVLQGALARLPLAA